jgi:membrane-bound PQQ-dependent dehydrogenase (glucose/quinate/shikimate family)
MTTTVSGDTSYRRPYVFLGLLFASGAALSIGGARLALLGGSVFYLLAGLLNLTAAVLFWRRDSRGALAYASLLLVTLGWSVWEVGTDPWALISRLWLASALGLWLALPSMRRRLGQGNGAMFAGGMAIFFVALIAIAFLRPEGTATDGVLPGAAPGTPGTTGAAPTPDRSGDWRHYGNTLRGTRFSPLSEINTGNVGQLQVAWTFRSGDVRDVMSAHEATPLKIGDALFTCTPNSAVIALNASTGKLLWRHDPAIEPGFYAIRACRGVAYFESPVPGDECPARVIAGTLDGRLLALNAKTGALCKGFGADGVVRLHDGMGIVKLSQQFMTSPATIVNGHVIVGMLVPDNQSIDMPSGVIRSFDPLTGALQWAWDMGVPERSGAPPPGETYTRSTPNAWTIFAADEGLGLVYVPTGNPSPDSWGGKRRPFDEKYGSSIVALDVETGRPRWSYQTVHHDLWDYDLPAQPSLVDLAGPDGPRPALVQSTKRGDIFVLDRRTGEPIVPVTERPVPQGASEGDWTSKTQPFSALTLASKKLMEADMWGVALFDQMTCRIQFRQSRYEGIFTPPGTDPIIEMPGLTGTINWGGVSIDADRNVLVANYMTLPWRGRLIPRAEVSKEFAAAPLAGLGTGTPYAWKFAPWLGPAQVPCTRPPWGSLTAIDLTSRRVLWNHAVGTGEDTGPFGISSRIPLTIGVPSLSGTLTTRGGLIFLSGTADQYLRGIDLATGRELWKARLPAGGQATPMTYMADGRQFVVVSAGGNMLMRTKFGDYTIAFALPRQRP